MSRLRRARNAPPLILGHRGVRGLGAGTPPENTLEAFELSMLAGADGVELDVRTCATGELVVFHDPTLTRMTQGTDTRAIAKLSWDELRHVDIGAGAHVPLLDDVLAWAKGHDRIVNVEMKSDVPNRGAVVRAVAAAIERHGDTRSIVVSSFDPVMLARLSLRKPREARGLLFHHQQWLTLRAGWLAPLFDVDAVHPEHVLLNERTIRAWKRRCLVNTWTVNEEGEAERLAALGVDAIITDDPARIGKVVRAACQPPIASAAPQSTPEASSS